MKNKIFFIIVLFFFFNKVIADNFLRDGNIINFEAEEIESINENLIYASGNVRLFNSKKQIIESEKLEINKKNSLYKFSNNVRLIDLENNIEIFSNLVEYNQNDELIYIKGDVSINKKKKLFITTSDLIYDNEKKILISNNNSKINDEIGNIITTNKFKYFIYDNYINASNVNIIDKDGNDYLIDEIKYDINKKAIYAKDISINENNLVKANKKNLARSKSRSAVITDDFIKLRKSVYTNCNKNLNCNPWLFQSDEISHDKNKKRIDYKNATLKLLDFPVFYFPKFFHPDPTVIRQSGFLTPSITNSNNDSFVNIPYYFVINERSDLTFSPRLNINGKNLYQSEYRKVTKNSDNIFDFSLFDNKSFFKSFSSTNMHFFSNSKIKLESSYFENSSVDIKIETVSDDEYLKVKNIKSPIINSQASLNSKIQYEAFNKNSEFLFSTLVFKDLTKEDDQDSYEFILPNLSYSKNLNIDSNNLLMFNTSAHNKIYDTNINEKILINNLKFETIGIPNKYGFINNYELNLKNFNSDSKNSKKLKNELSTNFESLLQFNSNLPLLKKGANYNQQLTPKIAIKLNPNKNKNLNNSDRRINYDNIFSSDRIGSNETLEGGNSVTVGKEYKIINDNYLNKDIFSLNLAASFRDNENEDLPKKSSLNKKTSDIFGNSKININDSIDLNYNFNVKNNLQEFNYHELETNFKVNNFVTSFKFIEENNIVGNESLISNETSYNFNENQKFLFNTRRNKRTNITEYYNMIYQYKVDCLTAEIKYNKNYYNDRSLKPEESINFSLTFMPFDNTVNLPLISN